MDNLQVMLVQSDLTSRMDLPALQTHNKLYAKALALEEEASRSQVRAGDSRD